MQLFDELRRQTDEGRPFVLATVISTRGSTPQKPGSKMLVLDDGHTIGTVGGGAIELQVVTAGRALLADTGAATQLLETQLTHELGMCCGGTMTVFLEKHGASAKLWVFGAGHVAHQLAALASHVGFAVTVVDDRPEWASAARFPTAKLLVRHPAQVAAELTGGPDCYFCITTHDHPLDQACLEALLRKPAAYLGVIGSRRKAARFRQRLAAAGFSEAELQRFKSPMGVAIAALTPAEIAVSIVGELISVRRSPAAVSAIEPSQPAHALSPPLSPIAEVARAEPRVARAGDPVRVPSANVAARRRGSTD